MVRCGDKMSVGGGAKFSARGYNELVESCGIRRHRHDNSATATFTENWSVNRPFDAGRYCVLETAN